MTNGRIKTYGGKILGVNGKVATHDDCCCGGGGGGGDPCTGCSPTPSSVTIVISGVTLITSCCPSPSRRITSVSGGGPNGTFVCNQSESNPCYWQYETSEGCTLTWWVNDCDTVPVLGSLHFDTLRVAVWYYVASWPYWNVVVTYYDSGNPSHYIAFGGVWFIGNCTNAFITDSNTGCVTFDVIGHSGSCSLTVNI